MEIFKLFGSIFIDNEKANQSIAKTEKQAESLSSKLGNGIKTAAKWGAGIAMGAAAAGTALFATASKAAEATDRIDKMSQKLGMTREGFQEWDFILSQNGASIDSLGAGMKTLTNQVDELAKGGKVATEAFTELGLSYDDLAGLSRQEIFEKTIVALQGIEDETKRAALANDLLGRSGQELAPLLNAGSDSIEKMKQQARDLGLIINDEAIDAGVKFTDTMDQLKRSFGAVFTQIGTAVMPIMQKLAEWVISNMPTIQSIMQAVFSAIGNVVNWVGDIISQYIIPVLNQLWEWIQPNLPAMQELFQLIFDTIGKILNGFVEVIKFVINWVQQWVVDNQAQLASIQEKFSQAFTAISEFISSFVEWAKAFWNEYGQSIMSVTETIWNTISTIIDVALTLIRDIFNIFSALFKGDWEAVWEGIKALFSDIWNGIGEILNGALETIKQAVSLAWDWIKDITGGVWEGIKEVISNVWDGIVDTVKGAVNGIIKAINGMIKALNRINFSIPDWVPGLGGKSFGFNLRTIPLLAEGGEIIQKGYAIVGEKGPELLELPKGARVSPLGASAGTTINITGNTFRNRSDIDYMIDQLRRVKL